jgi:hypothetical protein
MGADAKEVEGALSQLALAKGIRHKRNSIAIERDRLELSACECYETLRESYGRTLSS